MFSVYAVFGRSVTSVMRLRIWLPLLRLASTGTAPLVALSVAWPSICMSTGSLNWIMTSASGGNCVNPLAGLTAVTCGPPPLQQT